MILNKRLRLRDLARRFTHDAKGNVVTIAAVSMIPLVGLVGLSADYGIALMDKSKLDNATDTAALAAVSTAKAYVAANPTDTSLTANAIAAGKDRASRTFTVNAGSLPFATVPTPTITLVRTGQTFSSTVTYTATTQNHFGQLFQTPTMTLKGSAGAAADIPSYLDFYLLVDVSGSMGLPSTSDGQALLASKNNDNFSAYQQGCQFACHFSGYQGWQIAKDNSIQLRSAAVNNAVCSFLGRTANPQVVNQYKVGIYPFVTMMTTSYAALSGSYASLNSKADCTSSPPRAFDNLLDTGVTQYPTGGDKTTGTGSGGTNLGPSPNDSNSIFVQMKTEVVANTTAGSARDGTSAINSRPFVFLITDGMENPQHYYNGKSGGKYLYTGGNFDGLRAPVALDAAQCDDLKKTVTIAVLYIPYVPLVYKADPYNENAATNAAIPDLPTNLKKCASTGFFYTANSPADITAALNSMFNQAVQVTHLQQ